MKCNLILGTRAISGFTIYYAKLQRKPQKWSKIEEASKQCTVKKFNLSLYENYVTIFEKRIHADAFNKRLYKLTTYRV